MNTGFLGPAVATVPTVYGIETAAEINDVRLMVPIVATVPTVYGIETLSLPLLSRTAFFVATVPTVYGIETISLLRT